MRILPASDDAIFPDLTHGSLRIESAWDNHPGYHALPDNRATDSFLRKFHPEHCMAALADRIP
ncbi:MAG: hypothetical protein OSW77_10695 [Proteobacteria bacterium]|jgi:hypothetical protein|nr:hypothetical protein [Pseudomonadota bacterium]